MTPTTHLVASGLALALAMAGWSLPVAAADCGDSAGPGGTRVACMCGDSVVTDTLLEPDDGVVNGQCAAVGLAITRNWITLDCNGLALVGNDFSETGVVIESNGAVVQRCPISGFDIGIRGHPGAWRNRILSNTLEGNRLVGIVLGSSSRSNDVVDNVANNNGEIGIQINSSSHDIHVIGNQASGNSVAGIQFNSGSAQNQVILNHVAGEGRRGIQFNSSAERNVVASNTVAGGDLGINFNSNSLQNSVSGNGISGTQIAGIRFSEGGERNRISRNLISDNRGEGLRIEEQGTRNLLRSNFVFSSAENGIKVCGVSNVVARNEARFNGDWDICAVAGNIDIRNAAGEVTFDCPVRPDCEPLQVE